MWVFSGKICRVVVNSPFVGLVYVCGQEEESRRAPRG